MLFIGPHTASLPTRESQRCVSSRWLIFCATTAESDGVDQCFRFRRWVNLELVCDSTRELVVRAYRSGPIAKLAEE
jgi:hypothetical protein